MSFGEQISSVSDSVWKSHSTHLELLPIPYALRLRFDTGKGKLDISNPDASLTTGKEASVKILIRNWETPGVQTSAVCSSGFGDLAYSCRLYKNILSQTRTVSHWKSLRCSVSNVTTLSSSLWAL